jgi:tryptophan-rich sensory protein
MVLIDTFLVSGWALDVISIVSFASVIISGILFFTDFNRQKQNMLPMFYLIVIALIWSMVGLFSALEVMSWPLIVLGGVTLLLLAVIIITLRGDFIRELKCRFHLK